MKIFNLRKSIICALVLIGTTTALGANPTVVVENIVYQIDLETKEATCIRSNLQSKKYLDKAVIADEVEYEGELFPVTSIGAKAFYEDVLNTPYLYGIQGSLTLGKNVKTIKTQAFYNSELTNERLILPEGLESVDHSGLRIKKQIDEIVFPKSFKIIAEGGHTTGKFKRAVFLSETPPDCPSGLANYFYCVPKYMNDYELKYPYLKWLDAGLLAKNLVIDQPAVELNCNETQAISVSVEPEYLKECVKWSIEPAGIAYVDAYGQLTGLSSGTAVLTAQCGELKADCIIKVRTSDSGNSDSGNNGDKIKAKIDSFVFMNPDETLKLSDFVQNNTEIVSWETSNDEIVDVTKRGNAESYEYGYAFLEGKDASGGIVTTVAAFVCPTISVEYSEGKSYEHHVIYNSTPSLYIAAPEGYEIVGISHDGEDITEAVKANEGYYTPISPITDNTVISVSLKSTATPGDLNGDGKVDSSDLNWLLEQIMNF